MLLSTEQFEMSSLDFQEICEGKPWYKEYSIRFGTELFTDAYQYRVLLIVTRWRGASRRFEFRECFAV